MLRHPEVYEPCSSPSRLAVLRSRSLSHPRPSHSGAGFDFRNGGGFYKGNALAGFTNAPGYSGYYKPNQVVPPTPPSKAAKDIAINFTMVDFHGSVNVYDIWQSKALGAFEGSFTVRAPTAWLHFAFWLRARLPMQAKAVPYHGSAFLRLSPA